MSALTVLRKSDPGGAGKNGFRPDLGRAIEVGFRLLGWSAVTLLAAAGVFVVAFAMLGNFSVEGFFLQLANLADRYGAADTPRRLAFQGELRFVAAILLLTITFFRRASLRAAFFDGGRRGE